MTNPSEHALATGYVMGLLMREMGSSHGILQITDVRPIVDQHGNYTRSMEIVTAFGEFTITVDCKDVSYVIREEVA